MPAPAQPLKYAETLDPQERQNLQRAIDYSAVQCLSDIWAIAARHFGRAIALDDPHGEPARRLTYAETYDEIRHCAAGLQVLLGRESIPALGDRGSDRQTLPPRIALFADNSHRWLLADQGSLMAGLADVVRSATAETRELLYILEDSGAIALMVENRKTLDRLAPGLADLPLQAIVLLSDEVPDRPKALPESIPCLNFNELMELGARHQVRPTSRTRESLATLIYTSGTTGKPKGVMLTHGNLLHQLETAVSVVSPPPGSRALSILPTWHSFGRIGDYFLLSQGCQIVYTSIRHIKADFKAHRPHYMLSVPRIWESTYEGIQKQLRSLPEDKQRSARRLLGLSEGYVLARRRWQGLELKPRQSGWPARIVAGLKALALWGPHRIGEAAVYRKIREALGGEFRYAISGGGSLASYLELFYEIVGIQVLVGYGLTETAPILSVRRPWCNLRGTSGRPLPLTELRVVDPETRRPLPPGESGLVLARGPQVMQGYFNKPEATAKAIDPDGWFDTGDLGWLSDRADLVISGRAKDTIVLTNGENIEPQPIEDACIRSSYIDQVMLVGQDQKTLGALIVPNFEALAGWASDRGLSLSLPGEAAADGAAGETGEPLQGLNDEAIVALFRQEVAREVQNRPGYRPEERVGPIRLLSEPFALENGLLTQTLKLKRPVVTARYRDMIDGMFESN